MRTLIIDSGKSFTQNLSFFLKSKDMVVDTALSGEDGWELARLYDYDIIIMENRLSDKTGYDILKHLRLSGNMTPVIVISSEISISEKVKMLTQGADDYLVKPFDKNELVARMQAVVRRCHGHAGAIIKIGQMEINMTSKTVFIAGQPLKLTGKEYALLELLCLRRGMMISKEQFLNYLYGGIDTPEVKIIDVFLCRIRRKIKKLSDGKQYIHTAWGRGYILKED